jgi:outer membrane immunogenic protein
VGYQAGAGVEARLGRRWSVVGEYLFTDLDNREESTILVRGPAPATNPFILVNAGGTQMQRSDKFEIDRVSVSLRFRF